MLSVSWHLTPENYLTLQILLISRTTRQMLCSFAFIWAKRQIRDNFWKVWRLFIFSSRNGMEKTSAGLLILRIIVQARRMITASSHKNGKTAKELQLTNDIMPLTVITGLLTYVLQPFYRFLVILARRGKRLYRMTAKMGNCYFFAEYKGTLYWQSGSPWQKVVTHCWCSC